MRQKKKKKAEKTEKNSPRFFHEGMRGTRLKGELEEKLDNTSGKVDTQHYHRLYY